MAKICRVLIDGDEFAANRGDLLLDAALMNGVDIPYDCRAGQCGTCLVHVMEGRVFGGQTVDPKTVHACQCRVISDLVIAVEQVPEVETISARVVSLKTLAPDVIEVRLGLSRSLFRFPGQYCRVLFRGFPARCYSPTVPLDAAADARFMHLHIRMMPEGRVSSALGKEIREGHRMPKLTARDVIFTSGPPPACGYRQRSCRKAGWCLRLACCRRWAKPEETGRPPPEPRHGPPALT
jgi:ferredoxin